MNHKKALLVVLLLLSGLLSSVAVVGAQAQTCSEEQLIETYGQVSNFADDWYFYQSAGGEAFLYIGDVYHNMLLHSQDGYSFQVLCQTGSGPDDPVKLTAKEIHYFDPASDDKGSITISFKPHEPGQPLIVGDLAVSDGTSFPLLAQPPATIKLQPLPELFIPIGIYSFEDGDDYLLLSADKYHFSDETIQLALITPGGNYSFDIVGINRLRDGGTVIILTSEGTLTVPAQTRDLPATWGDLVLTTHALDACTVTFADPITVACK